MVLRSPPQGPGSPAAVLVSPPGRVAIVIPELDGSHQLFITMFSLPRFLGFTHTISWILSSFSSLNWRSLTTIFPSSRSTPMSNCTCQSRPNSGHPASGTNRTSPTPALFAPSNFSSFITETLNPSPFAPTTCMVSCPFSHPFGILPLRAVPAPGLPAQLGAEGTSLVTAANEARAWSPPPLILHTRSGPAIAVITLITACN